MNKEKTYVYAVANYHCHILDGIVFRNHSEASHAIHMVCDQQYKRDFKLISKRKYKNWLSNIVKGYWGGNYSEETANKKIKYALRNQTKYTLDDVWSSAVYWDFYEMFYIDKQPIVNDMGKLYENIKKIKAEDIL